MTSSQKKLQKSHSLRQRITPTYIHHQIFNDNPSELHRIRCTPTFTSTAFDCDGYNTITTHSKAKQEERPRTGSITYRNVSKQRKQIEVFSYKGINQEDNCKQTDRKEQMLNSINDYGVRTSRMRKIVEQMSNPIFGSTYFWQPEFNQRQKVNNNHQKQSTKQVQAQIKQQLSKENDENIVNETKIKEIAKENNPKETTKVKGQAQQKKKVENKHNKNKATKENVKQKTNAKKQPHLVKKK